MRGWNGYANRGFDIFGTGHGSANGTGNGVFSMFGVYGHDALNFAFAPGTEAFANELDANIDLANAGSSSARRRLESSSYSGELYRTETVTRWTEYDGVVNVGSIRVITEFTRKGGTQNNPFPRVNQRTHSVRKGDNLYRIGLRHGVSVRTLKRLNGLRNNTIKPGQRLIIETINRASIRTYNQILNTRIDYRGAQRRLRNTPFGEHFQDRLEDRLSDPYYGKISGVEFILFRPHVNVQGHWLNVQSSEYWLGLSWSERARDFDVFCSDGKCE